MSYNAETLSKLLIFIDSSLWGRFILIVLYFISEAIMLRRKIAVVLAAMLVFSAGAFALGEGWDLYGRLNVGYETRMMPAKFDYKYGYWINNYPYPSEWHESTITYDDKDAGNLFSLLPAFGIMFAPESDNLFWRGFGAEAQLGLSFGKSAIGTAVAINPGVMAKWHFFMPDTMPVIVQRIVPYAGLGFSVPICIVSPDGYDGADTSVKGGFDVNINIGCGFEVLPKLRVTLDYDLGLGTSISNSVRVGAIWKFRGGERPELWNAIEAEQKAREEQERVYRERETKYPNSRAPGESEAEFQSRMNKKRANDER